VTPPVLEQPLKPAKALKDFGTGGIRLNLGGAGEGFLSGKIPGFLTVDLREVPETDILGDVRDLSMFTDGTVDEIYSSNVLEHFPHVDTINVLKEWCRVLKPGGKLWLSVPDFDATVKLYLKEGLVPWVKYLAWGDQAHPLNYHYINFTFGSLALDASKAGFRDIKRHQSLPFGIKDASEHRDNLHGIRISLNVEVIK
jgi:predicted SAM-dependent methyltransferase